MTAVALIALTSSTTACNIYGLTDALREPYRPVAQGVVSRNFSSGGHGSPFVSGYSYVSCNSGLSATISSVAMVMQLDEDSGKMEMDTISSTSDLSLRDYLRSGNIGQTENMPLGLLQDADQRGFPTALGAEKAADRDVGPACRRAHGLSDSHWSGDAEKICAGAVEGLELNQLDEDLCAFRAERMNSTGANQ